MKTPVVLRLSLVLLACTLAPLAQAQAPSPSAPDPALGYWNIETNLATRDHTIVRFYNADHKLVYAERLDDLCLDLARRGHRSRRTSRQLTAVLHRVLTNPATGQAPNLLAQQFGTNRRVQRVYAVR